VKQTAPPYTFDEGVTLVGGAAYTNHDFYNAYSLAPTIIAADSGSNNSPIKPDLIIGDMDSATPNQIPTLYLKEQSSTDFEKCLYSTIAPFYIGVGFSTQRFDHSLAACHALIKYCDKHIFLLGETDIIFSIGTKFQIILPIATRFSIFPLLPVRCLSGTGLKWPIENRVLSPGGLIGTSNQTTHKTVKLNFETVGALGILPKSFLSSIVSHHEQSFH